MTRARALQLSASLVLGLAMGLSNVLAYLFVILLSKSLGPSDFGGFSALNTYGTLLAMPAGAFQVVVARHVARQRSQAGAAPPSPSRTATSAALAIGGALFGLSVVISPLLTSSFSLPSAWSVVWLAAMLPPMILTGAWQGLLLGTERLGRLAVVYLVTAGTRLGAAVLAVALGFGVTEVFAATFVASLITAGVARLLAAPVLIEGPRGRSRPLLAEVVRSNAALAALMVMSSVDVVLARYHLDQDASGDYALASLFGRVVFWGTQFLALTLVPQMQVEVQGHRRSSLHRGAALIIGLGALVAAGAALVPGLLVRLTGGAAYADAEPLLVWYALTGTAWALVQAWLYAEMATGGRAVSRLVWGLTAVEVLIISLWAHRSTGEVLAAAGVTAALAALGGYLLVRRERDLSRSCSTPSRDTASSPAG